MLKKNQLGGWFGGPFAKVDGAVNFRNWGLSFSDENSRNNRIANRLEKIAQTLRDSTEIDDEWAKIACDAINNTIKQDGVMVTLETYKDDLVVRFDLPLGAAEGQDITISAGLRGRFTGTDGADLDSIRDCIRALKAVLHYWEGKERHIVRCYAPPGREGAA